MTTVASNAILSVRTDRDPTRFHGPRQACCCVEHALKGFSERDLQTTPLLPSEDTLAILRALEDTCRGHPPSRITMPSLISPSISEDAARNELAAIRLYLESCGLEEGESIIHFLRGWKQKTP
jgi:hypothetical protein